VSAGNKNTRRSVLGNEKYNGRETLRKMEGGKGTALGEEKNGEHAF